MSQPTISSSSPPHYDLYYNPFSICSLMVLYTFRLKGSPKSPADAVEPEERLIDIYAGEQMTEAYLEKHPKGTVPALLSPTIGLKLIDSTDITSYLMTHYPSLCPPAHKETITSLLEELHEISYVTLSFKPEERRVEGVMETVRAIMQREETSERYKTMLKGKLDGHASNLQKFHDSKQSVASVEADSLAFLDKIARLLSQHPAPQTWIFGAATGPTALDAHTIVFIARLLDAKRESLIPQNVLEYAQPKLVSEEWLGITQGRPTLHSLWVKGQQH